MPSSELRALVVDDEAPARTALRHRLASLGGVEVVGEATSGREALRAVGELDPEVVFLDIEMADGGGFDVIERLPEDAPPAVVFVTAYDQYAVAAFEAQALDYVLKPVSRERLEEVVRRVRERLEVEREADEHRRLLARIEELRAGAGRDAPVPEEAGREEKAGAANGRIVVKRRGEYVLVPFEEVRWLEAAGNYVRIHARGGSILHRASLAALEETLPAERFARVHRSAIVNVARIERVVPNDSGDFEIHLDSEETVKMSRSYRDRLLA